MRADTPAFVQVEHAMAAYYADHHPASRWILSMHNVDAAGASDRGARRALGPPRVRAGSIAVRRAARAAPAADVVVCVSDADREHFEGLGGRTLLVPNGIDDEFFDVPTPLPAGERCCSSGDSTTRRTRSA